MSELPTHPLKMTRKPKKLKKPKPPALIVPANIEWQTDDAGNNVPVSGEFGDVYFSHADGLAESRHVFLEGNQLSKRLIGLAPQQYFTVAELGFGTGLNVLALWQLWQQLRATHSQLTTARLHMITTEKHPIALKDLTQILTLWGQRAPELAGLIEQLLASYPPLIAGCHRLSFAEDNFTVDIWLGDATDSLASLGSEAAIKHPYIDAWFLDGFAPSCNESLWAESIFTHIQRLSYIGTTAATYSCAGIVKRALQDSDFEIKKAKGFGRKREMLTAVMVEDTQSENIGSEKRASTSNSANDNHNDNLNLNTIYKTKNHKTKNHKIKKLSATFETPHHTIVIGAGVAGLLMAWSLANRGVQITIVDKTAPLAGASGNPRALLAPNMTPIHHVYDHLHTIGYLYSSRLYCYFNQQAAINNTTAVFEPTGTLDLLVKTNIGTEQISDYPDEMATTLSPEQASNISGLKVKDLSNNLYLPQAGLVNPQALKAVILAHPLISFQQLQVIKINETDTNVCIIGNRSYDNESKTAITIHADNVVICAAYESCELDDRIVDCRKIRGQLSWFTPTAEQYDKLPKLPLKYGGYCALFDGQTDNTQLDDTQLSDTRLNTAAAGRPQFLLGASFIDNDANINIRSDENQQNRDKLVMDIPELDKILPTDTSAWHARAGIRTQTIDYHPLVGLLAGSKRIWTLSAMGAKGYAIAPICAESLADMMLGCFTPLSAAILARLSPNRTRLHKP